MATGRTSHPVPTKRDGTAQRDGTAKLHGLPSLPDGVIPTPRAASDPMPAPATRSRRRTTLFIAVPVVVAAGVGAAVVGLTQSAAPVGEAATAQLVQRSPADLGFLKIVRQQPGFGAVPDGALIGIGHSVCGQLQGGMSPAEIALGSSGAKFSVEDVSTAVGAAAGAYCPEQISRVGLPE